MRIARAVQNLTEAFERLPGIGPKTAQRLTYYLLHVPQGELDKLADSVAQLKAGTKVCSVCFNIAETDPCDICGDERRSQSTLCVVEQPLNVVAMEKVNGYSGVYHVLNGVIDPLHNIGPDEIRIGELVKRVRTAVNAGPVEVILALNPNMEGEATGMYIAKQLEDLRPSGLTITRLAAGLPVGADIEYADEITLGRALSGRREY